jgi:GAF domain-containing protein
VSKLEISTELLTALQELSALLETDDVLATTLRSIADLSVSTLPGCDAAGVTLRGAKGDMTAAASDEYALEIDHIQYDSDEGPCVAALAENQFHHIVAVSEETRWPEFCRQAEQRGFRSSLSYPLHENGSVGALNIYSKRDDAFDEASIAVGGIFAAHATIALRNAHTYVAARDLTDQLNEALKSRDMIGQAKGILMERENVSDDAAFAMLRTISQNANVKLRDVAERLIEEKARATGESHPIG